MTKLIHIRRASMSLNDGDTGHTQIRFDEEKSWLAMDRGPVRVLVNLGAETAGFEVAAGVQG